MSILSTVRNFLRTTLARAKALWQRFRALPKRTQTLSWVGLAILVILVIVFFPKGPATASPESLRSVTLRSVGELSLGEGSNSIFGTVRSISEASILAKTSGTVEAVHTSIGATVPANFIIAELENASEQASVLQAQGTYEAALAAQASATVGDEQNSAEATADAAFTSLDTALEVYVDTLFQGTASDPNLIIDGGGWENSLSNSRARIHEQMAALRRDIEAGTLEPTERLDRLATIASDITEFLNELANVANRPNSRATTAQTDALQTARTSVSSARSSIATAQASYRSGSIGATAGTDASVKQALGTLRLAQANLERTRVRAPIAGTVNFLPIRVGDYVTQNTHAATVARNEALEVIAFVSDDMSKTLTTGTAVVVEDETPGTITSIAPALNPVTKQIEVRIAVDASAKLVNGVSVRIEIPSLAKEETATVASGPLTLPLSAVKLRAHDRIVFGIGEDARLIAYLVETGTVRGDRIEVTNTLPLGLSIVTDARGLSEGQKVNVAP